MPPDLFPDPPADAPSRPGGERLARVALALVPGVGAARQLALVARFGSAAAVFAAPARALAAVEGVGAQTAAAVAGFRDWDAAEQQLARAERVGARLVALGDAEYPDLLRHVYDPPAQLWVRGRLTPADAAAVAVVGTRRASDYGLRAAAHLARGLAEAGVTVVSGLAYGIDAAAHAAALEAGGRTVAVLGSGVDRVYPARHAGLARRILDADAGAVVSEMPMGAAPDAGNFPRRNRIIAGMSLGTLVAEAFDAGGASLTAAIALDQNREVFAVPAPLFAEARGTNALIRGSGAALVESAADVLEVLAPRMPARAAAAGAPAAPAVDLSPPERRLLDALGTEPRPLDAVCDAAGLGVAESLGALLALELHGLVRQLPGKQFARA